MRVDLKQRVGTDLLDSKCWGGGKEASVLNFLDCLPNGQNERSVDERQDDIGVVRICINMVSEVYDYIPMLLTILLELRRPHSIWNTRDVGADDLLDLKTMAECPECAPCPPPTRGENLRGIGVWKQLHHLRIDDWAQGLHFVHQRKIVKRSWPEVRAREGACRIRHAVRRIVSRAEFGLVIVVAEFLELVEVAIRA